MRRVFIVGGGPSALTCAWNLLNEPVTEPLDITILQMGWRLGGKGASGRNRREHNRIEEHGLHIMFGFYQNFFRMISEVYRELDRSPGAPLRTWQEAFSPYDAGVVMDFYEGVWSPLIVELPRNRAVPGRGTTVNDSRTYLGAALGAAIEVALGWRVLDDLNTLTFGDDNRGGLVAPDPSAGSPDVLVRYAMRMLQAVLEVGFDANRGVEERANLVVALLKKLRMAMHAFLHLVIDRLGRRAHLLVDGIEFLTAFAAGIVADGVLLPDRGGYDGIDVHDFADWLVSHGMDERSRDSVAVRFLYDAAFSFTPRDEKPQLSAGVAVRTLLRMGCTYKGAMYYKMNGGMGDVIIAPLYEALRQRGVRFGFFQKVEDIAPHPVDNRIERIQVRIQAEPKAGPWSYEPLFDCEGLPSWPSEPFYEQLVEGTSLQDMDLESYYQHYESDRFIDYQVGRDFDELVLATPVPCLPFIGPKLIARSLRFSQMVRHVKAVPTMALQTWFKPTLQELGWRGPNSPLLSLYVDPLNTWSDMSQVLPRESWPSSLKPGSVAYFCGPQSGHGALPPPVAEQPDYPHTQHAEAHAAGIDLLEYHLKALLPNAARPDGSFNWDLVIDPLHRTGRGRYEAQYVRSNSEPSEWCTLSLPNTNQYRMRAGDTGFRNLTVCGDWIDNGFHIACLEGAVMGGMYAARAVSRVPIPIIGEFLDMGLTFGDLPPEPRPAPVFGNFPEDRKVKVAVLGSGVGSMAAAWALAHSPAAARFEITVYQYGWRLGGKCASGRNSKIHERIEEHGLHIWGGCYENAFQIIQEAYKELGRAPGSPLSVWHDPDSRHASAFWPHSDVSVADRYGNAWSFFNINLPENTSNPGDGRLVDEPTAYIQMLVELLIELMTGSTLLHRHDTEVESGLGIGFARGLNSLVSQSLVLAGRVFRALTGPAIAERLRSAGTQAIGRRANPGPLLDLLQLCRRALLIVLERLFEANNEARWMLEGIDLIIAILTGVLVDNVMEHGFDVVDNEEFSDFLRRHGATELTLDGLIVRGWHNFFFAYLDGDARRPSLSASSALRTIVRYVFTYKGAFFWKMQAGMGDAIFAPLYEALEKRGVKFEFFCRVAEVSCIGEEGPEDTVHRITIERQVRLAPGHTRYSPLKTAKGIPSWPSEPLWDQLSVEDRNKYHNDAWKLESSWNDVPPVETFELHKGEHFDLVVLGLSSGPLATVCPSLVAHSAAMRDAAALPTNQTLAAQLWLNKTYDEMGWPARSTVGTAYANPQNTWANMDYLIEREQWEAPPKALLYLCGTYTDAEPIPPLSDAQFPIVNRERVRQLTVEWLKTFWGPLYPNAVAEGSQGIDWSLLVDDANQAGEPRMQSQFWRGNIDPSERYVLSPPGTASVRRRAWELGFDNLFGAGDWLYNGMMAGCVEGACMGGLQAAQAICGYPQRIVGDEELPFATPRRRT